MPEIGRNDPCPCGSGRKHKKCCLAGASLVSVTDDQEVRENAMGRLLHFADRPQFDGDREIASTLFWSEYLDELSEEAEYDLLNNLDTEAKFNSFFLFDVDIDKGRTVAAMFLAQKGHELASVERAFLHRMAASCLAPYEITRVDPGEGVSVRDLITGEERFVVEHAGSRSMTKWDVLGARVVPDGTATLRFEGAVYLYPSIQRDVIVRELGRLRRQYERRNPGADLAAFLRRHSMFFNHLWMELVVLPQQTPPRLQTTDGDDVLFAAAQFDVLDEAAAMRALGERTDLERHDDGSFAWVEPRGDEALVLGTLFADGPRWRLQTMSKSRAERGRAWIESWAGDVVRHRGTTYVGVGDLPARAKAEPPRSASTLPPEVEATLIQEAQDAHYREWLDQPIPMFDGRTPREAVRSRRLKPRVIDVLKTMENASERARRAGSPSYDSRWLWDALALPYPSD